MKTFLNAQDEEIVLGRSIARLCAAVEQWQPEFKKKVKRRPILDGYYVPTRYPNSLIPSKVYTKKADLEAVGLAQETVYFTVKHILTINTMNSF